MLSNSFRVLRHETATCRAVEGTRQLVGMTDYDDLGKRK